EYLAREIASLRIALGEVATRDFLRSELARLADELDEAAHRREKRARSEWEEDRKEWDAIQAALATVDDPEIRRPITDLGMVKGFTVANGLVKVELLLTVAGCPLRDKLTTDITAAVTKVPGITGAEINFGVMNEEQR